MKGVAKVMDDLIRIPATRWRLGLDPLIGLLPGLGDAASGVVSAVAIFYASRGGLPRIVLIRMAANVVINGLLGAIPVFGDALSFWFKSNRRNYQLLAENIGKNRASPGDKRFMVGLLVVLIVILALVGFGIVKVWASVARWVTGQFS